MLSRIFLFSGYDITFGCIFYEKLTKMLRSLSFASTVQTGGDPKIKRLPVGRGKKLTIERTLGKGHLRIASIPSLYFLHAKVPSYGESTERTCLKSGSDIGRMSACSGGKKRIFWVDVRGVHGLFLL